MSPERGAELLLHVRPGLLGVVAALVEHPSVDGADTQLRHAVLVEHGDVLVLDLDDGNVRDHVLRRDRIQPVARLRIEMLQDLEVSLQLGDRHAQAARELRTLMALQELQVVGLPDDGLAGSSLEPEVTNLQQQALLRIARRHAYRIEGLDEPQHPLDLSGRPRAHRGDLVDRRYEVAVLVQVADDGGPDLAEQIVARAERELPGQVVCQGTRRRQRVLDRRQLLDLPRGPMAVAVVEVVAEEVLVVGVVPGVLPIAGRLGIRIRLVDLRGSIRLLLLLGRNLLEQRVLDYLLGQQVDELQRGHREQLDRLLQRRRQDQLLGQPCLQLLLYCHGDVRACAACDAGGLSRS